VEVFLRMATQKAEDYPMVFLKVADPFSPFNSQLSKIYEFNPKLETLRKSEYQSFSLVASDNSEFIVSFSI
jgi:hypothetical protein